MEELDFSCFLIRIAVVYVLGFCDSHSAYFFTASKFFATRKFLLFLLSTFVYNSVGTVDNVVEQLSCLLFPLEATSRVRFKISSLSLAKGLFWNCWLFTTIRLFCHGIGYFCEMTKLGIAH